VTNFFEAINISSRHIYHSALELSPKSSIIRRLYYHRHSIPLPRLVTGAPDSWSAGITILSKDYDYLAHTWSQCGQFVAIQKRIAVEIRGSSTLDLLFTLKPNKPTTPLRGPLVYSPDGHSLACLSNINIIIWDIQTRQIAKEIEYGDPGLCSLVWSLDGKTIATLVLDWKTHYWVIYTYDVTSATTLSPGTLQPTDVTHLWAHNKSFRIAALAWRCTVYAIDIFDFEIGSTLTKVKSFNIQLWGACTLTKSFSPTTYRTSISVGNQLVVLDIKGQRIMLQETNSFQSHCFSTDGGLFAASQMDNIHIWKYTSGCYTLLRKVSSQRPNYFQFSPTSPSILGHFGQRLRLWRLDIPPATQTPTPNKQLTVVSHNKICIATATHDTITITKFLSQTPSQFIDTGVNILGLALTGNVLLVTGSGNIVAWLLTGDGVVDGVFGSRRAGSGDSIWAISVPPHSSLELRFSTKHQTGVITCQGKILHVYHTGTGKVLVHSLAPSSNQGCHVEMSQGSYHHHCDVDIPPADNWQVSSNTLKEGWVKDPQGKHRLWLPVEWRISLNDMSWCQDITTLHFIIPGNEPIVIKF